MTATSTPAGAGLTSFAEPAVLPAREGGSLVDALADNAARFPGSVAISRRAGSGWQDVTCAQFHDEVRAVAKGIVASGVGPGDRVGVMSATRYEWTVVDYALWYAGAVPVPIYETSSAEQVQWILSDSGAVGVFLEGSAHRAVFDEVAGDLPEVTRVWVFDEGATGALASGGAGVADEELDARRATLGPASLATIMYTSGTTGRPKGCTLTHGNFLFEVDAVTSGAPELFGPGSSTLLFLPIAHVFGRIIQITCIAARVRLGHTADVKNVVADLAVFRPTFLLSVPRVFEKIYNGSTSKAHAEGKGRIFDRAAAVAIAHSQAQDAGGPSLWLRAQHGVFDRLVYSKLRAALGGEVTHAVSGGAALGARLGHFFRGIGLIIMEGYGLTETSAAATLNRPGLIRIGSVGRPLPGTEVRIGDDGEVLLRGPHIFAGYWNNPSATAEVIGADGWFHSGDIGELDADGFLSITGRKKELIVTSGGKNVAPAVLEDRLRAHPLVSHCMVVGDGRPYVAALVTLDTEALPAWLAAQGKPAGTGAAALVDDPELRAEIQGAVDDANRAVSHAEAIKRFAVLPVDWTDSGGQLTPTLKLKRGVVMAQFADAVEALYAG